MTQSSELHAEDAVPEFPQGGERIRGKARIMRSGRRARPRWTSPSGGHEGVIRYDGTRPHHFVGIMEFQGSKVVRETIDFGGPWDPPAWRGAVGGADPLTLPA